MFAHHLLPCGFSVGKMNWRGLCCWSPGPRRSPAGARRWRRYTAHVAVGNTPAGALLYSRMRRGAPAPPDRERDHTQARGVRRAGEGIAPRTPRGPALCRGGALARGGANCGAQWDGRDGADSVLLARPSRLAAQWERALARGGAQGSCGAGLPADVARTACHSTSRLQQPGAWRSVAEDAPTGPGRRRGAHAAAVKQRGSRQGQTGEWRRP